MPCSLIESQPLGGR